MTDKPCLRLAEKLEQSSEMPRRSQRLEILQSQLQQVNRRAAGPFSHPYATRGSLSRLRDQIRDVSRVADAVLLNAESAGDHRIGELCSDLNALLNAQRRWTDRLENQIWRLESQSDLVRRLSKLLWNQPTNNEDLWTLCEVIARETQSLPTGLLLLPEPGHRLLLSDSTASSRVSLAIEQARLVAFSAMTLLPEVKGSDIVAQTLHTASPQLLSSMGLKHDVSLFAAPQWKQRAAITGPTVEARRLVKVAGHFLTAIETLSQTAADSIVPPAVPEFFSGIIAFIARNPEVSEPDIATSRAIGRALGLTIAKPVASPFDESSNDEAATVLTHKLHWHDAASGDSHSRPAFRPKRVRHPHFSGAGVSATSLTLFARED